MTKVILLLVFLALAFCDFLGDAKICTQSTGDLDRDIEYCTRAIQSGELSDEDLVITFYTRGVAYYYKGEYDPALRDFDQAIKLNPTSPKPSTTEASCIITRATTSAQFATSIRRSDSSPTSPQRPPQ